MNYVPNRKELTIKKIAAALLLFFCFMSTRTFHAQCNYGVMQFPISCSCPDGSESFGLPPNVAIPGKGKAGYLGLVGTSCGNGCIGVYPAAGSCKAALSPSPNLLRMLDRISQTEPVFVADCNGGLEQYAPPLLAKKEHDQTTINLPADNEKADRMYLPMLGGQ